MFRYIKCRDVKNPIRWFETSSWIDFFIPNDLTAVKLTPQISWSFMMRMFDNDWHILLAPWEWLLIPSWIKTIIKSWYDLVFENKSWISTKQWLIIWAKVVDSEYRWEIHLYLINTSNTFTYIKLWQKVAQWILRKVELYNPKEISDEEFKKNEETERWEWGFGSTWEK